MSEKLQQMKAEYRAKTEFVANIFKQSKRSDGNFDLLKTEALRNLPDEAAAESRVKELQKELDDMQAAIKKFEASLAHEAAVFARLRELDEIPPEEKHIHGSVKDGKNGLPVEYKTLGQLVAADWPKGHHGPRDTWLNKTYDDFEIKAIMTTAAGWAPEITRIPRVSEFAHRPIQVTDMFPVGNTTEAGISYMEETTSTNTAAEVAEGAAIQQATLVFTERTVNIKKIGVHIPVTDEQLADVAQVQTLIDQRLRFFVQQRLDLQLMQGDGIGANILGLISTPNVLTYARGAETNMDAVFRAMSNVSVTGRATTTGIIIHPTNWTTIRLTTANGIYLYGPPTETGVLRLWGVPVAVSDTVPSGTAIVGDFASHSTLYTRQGVEVLAGFVNDDFTLGQTRIRATLRAALVVYRPAAFSLVTNLN